MNNDIAAPKAHVVSSILVVSLLGVQGRRLRQIIHNYRILQFLDKNRDSGC